MAYKGRFHPKNPHKYKGDPTKIIYRSSWEYKAMRHLDTNDDVVEWASEEFSIKYYSPVDKKIHRYFPDLWIKRKDGTVTVYEIKPKSQVEPPKVPKRKTKSYYTSLMLYEINKSKWRAADEFCTDRGWNFEILTEDSLGIKY